MLFICNGDNNGSINPQVGGGVPPYKYNWTGPTNFTSTLGTITDLDGGTYSIELTDENDCIYRDTIKITEPEAIEINTLEISKTIIAAADL